jgi:methyltransferase
MVIAYLVFLGLFGIERLAELWLSRRNARIALARGGVERGAAHFKVMAAVRVAFLPACAAEVLRHPNYAAVIAEMLAVPLAHGAWLCALIFSALNAALLAVRIPLEERALGIGHG